MPGLQNFVGNQLPIHGQSESFADSEVIQRFFSQVESIPVGAVERCFF